ncbi:hypothetical protein Bbelb_182540 [Branchiostoma belcheri]|nr:hypothetical protein Bbelb_182540 [Branchiostoma belcheri]
MERDSPTGSIKEFLMEMAAASLFRVEPYPIGHEEYRRGTGDHGSAGNSPTSRSTGTKYMQAGTPLLYISAGPAHSERGAGPHRLPLIGCRHDDYTDELDLSRNECTPRLCPGGFQSILAAVP